MGKKKKFIDANRDVVHSFKLVSRSQRDPLIADENAPQAVLTEAEASNKRKSEQEKYGIYFDDDYDYLKHLKGVKEAVEWDEEDLEVYTIRCQDPELDENDAKRNRLMLPSSLFESYVEEPIGMLNKAAPVTGPRPELDPDIVAELDMADMENNMIAGPDDEDAIPDNFVMMLNSENPLEEFEDEFQCGQYTEMAMPSLEEYVNGVHYDPVEYDDHNYTYRKSKSPDLVISDLEDDEERDEVSSLQGFCHSDSGSEKNTDKAPTIFTHYSLTSSVLPRSEMLTIIDDHFEEKFCREYDEEHVGALDGEDIEGYIGEESELFKQATKGSLKDDVKRIEYDGDDEKKYIMKWIIDMQKAQKNDDNEKAEICYEEKPDKSEQWDCESILSTYSNMDNHPKVISCSSGRRKKIQINPSTGMPYMPMISKGLTMKALKTHDLKEGRAQVGTDHEFDCDTLLTSISAISFRPKGETPEERRDRKRALKELRKERRIEKMMNKEAFKEEKKVQERNVINNMYSKVLKIM